MRCFCKKETSWNRTSQPQFPDHYLASFPMREAITFLRGSTSVVYGFHLVHLPSDPPRLTISFDLGAGSFSVSIKKAVKKIGPVGPTLRCREAQVRTELRRSSCLPALDSGS